MPSLATLYRRHSAAGAHNIPAPYGRPHQLPGAQLVYASTNHCRNGTIYAYHTVVIKNLTLMTPWSGVDFINVPGYEVGDISEVLFSEPFCAKVGFDFARYLYDVSECLDGMDMSPDIPAPLKSTLSLASYARSTNIAATAPDTSLSIMTPTIFSMTKIYSRSLP